MKRLISCLIFSVPLVCCQKAQPGRNVNVYSLPRDFSYAQQTSFVGSHHLPFENGDQILLGKKYPALVQKVPGSIDFYVQILNAPKLSFSLQSPDGHASKREARVILECDFPKKKKRQYRVPKDGPYTFKIPEFEGSVAKITFLSHARNYKDFGDGFLWVNPRIEHEPEIQTRKDDLQTFRSRHRKDNVLIFLFDATNASHLGCYGYSKPTSPVIDSLAAEGIRWENAFAQAPSTLASTGSLVTGLYPEAHGVLDRPDALPDQFKTMAEFFRDAGYRTALFSGNTNVSPLFGYEQGFEHVWRPIRGPANAADFVPEIKFWLNRVRNRSFFAYVHFREPHYPYNPPAEFLTRFSPEANFHVPSFKMRVSAPEQDKTKIVAAYDANLAYADEQLGKVLKHLKSTGLMSSTIIVVLADHGEAFWEHGRQGHNLSVYDEMIRIPLIIRFPQEPHWKGLRRRQVVGTIDILPTFMDLFEFKMEPKSLHGQSLLQFLEGGPGQMERFILSQMVNRNAYSLRSAHAKYIDNRKGRGKDEFYLLSQDPMERNNVVENYPVLSSFYLTELRKKRDQIEDFRRRLPVHKKRQAVIDPQAEEELRALGYIN